MDIRELRIGNLVHDPNQYGGATDIVIEYIHVTDETFEWYKDLQGIPLTEEWLVRMGLNTSDWFCESSYLIVKDGDFGWNLRVRNANHTKEIDFTYFQHVHQLQNLYHALTGHEISIND